MIGSVFKLFGFFFLCFLVLCIPVRGKTLFDHLFKLGTPVGKVIAEKAEDGFDKSKDFGEKLFSNSIPKSASDEIRLRNSSLKKATIVAPATDDYDAHSDQDQAELEKTIQGQY